MPDLDLTANSAADLYIESTGDKKTIEQRHKEAIDHCRQKIAFWTKMLNLLVEKR